MLIFNDNIFMLIESENFHSDKQVYNKLNIFQYSTFVVFLTCLKKLFLNTRGRVFEWKIRKIRNTCYFDFFDVS